MQNQQTTVQDTHIQNNINDGGAHKNGTDDNEPLHIPAKPAFAGGEKNDVKENNVENSQKPQESNESNVEDNDVEHSQQLDGGKKHAAKKKKGGLTIVDNQQTNQKQVTPEVDTKIDNIIDDDDSEENMLSIKYLEKIKSHKCNCVFWRDKGVSDFTCLIENEIKHLQKLTPLKLSDSTNVVEWYKNLVQQLGCQNSDDWDRCVLSKQFRNNPMAIKIYENAIPTIQKEYRDQWLTSFDVDRLLYGLEKNLPIYKYMGMACWDEFEDQLTNLNINFIIKTIKENPYKKVYGWVLNQCHKYSPGKHWVAMTFIKNEKTNKFRVYYYDSQGYLGPHNEKVIDCEMRIDQSNPNYEKYIHYKSHFDEWWNQLLSHHDVIENHQLPLFNNFETQGDNYSCGYHAVFFNFLCAKFAEGHKYFTPNSIALKILGNVRDTQLGKALDKYIKLFQNHCTISVQ